MYMIENEIEPNYSESIQYLKILSKIFLTFYCLVLTKSYRFFVIRHFFVLTKCLLMYANVIFSKWL